MTRFVHTWLGGAAVALFTLVIVMPGCGESVEVEGSQLSIERSAVLVGGDDRIEWYQVEQAALRARLADSSAALVYPHRLHFAGAAPVMDAPTLGQALNLCEGERFREQPSWSFCSGTLIDRDLLLTAGHCLGPSLPDAQDRCARLRVVFGYRIAGADDVASFDPAAVYTCRRIVVHRTPQGEGNASDSGTAPTTGDAAPINIMGDFAIIQLDRDATPEHSPVAIAARAPAPGDQLAIAGYGAGLPMKVELAASVTTLAGAEQFVAATDTFGGSSGSGLYDADQSLIGLHVSGAPDWRFDDGCARAAVVTVSGEQAQRASTALRALCAGGWPTSALCGTDSQCGDGVCGADEHDACPADCAAASCGDRLCDVTERAGCPADCDPYLDVPASWPDDPEIYRQMAASTANSSAHVASGGCAVSPADGDRPCAWPVVILLACAVWPRAARRRTASPGS